MSGENKNVIDDIKDYEKDKRVTELLSANLSEIKNSFKLTEDSTDQMILSADESFEEYKKEYEKSLDIVEPKVEPLGSTVITSCMISNVMDFGKYLIGQEFDVDLVKQFKEATSEDQIVLAVGPNCRQVKVGDKVSVRISDFTRIINPNTVNAREITEIPTEIIDDRKYLSIHENNIRYIIKDDNYYKLRE